ncbi:ABC transporter substrate-binding protein [Virgibacillus necropolis]|uniref:ABC transporter substrate-binding protein n=1 Tax=Virgibacillus necropolis TaxID=163877 RepID=UPI00384A9C7C
MKKGLLLIAIAMISMMVLVACSSDESSEASGDGEGKTYKVGATQIVEHPSLDEAYKGFQAALKDAGLNVEYDLQSAQGDQNNVAPIANNFVADNVDLIFANSTPSALGAVQATSEIPIIFTSVTDAVGAGLVKSMDEPGENVTGVLDLHPDAIQKTVEFIDANFEGANVGLIYNSGEQNSISQIKDVKAAVEGTSLSLSERTVASSAQVKQAATTLVGEADVFYIITDNTVVSALDSVIGVANEQDIPLIVGEPDSLKKGGFATFGIDYHKIGYRSGEMAAAILTGEKTTKDIPVEYPAEIQLFINKQASEKQGVEWNTEWDEKAKLVEQE